MRRHRCAAGDALLAAAALLLAAGCDSNDGNGDGGAERPARSEVTTTRVQVVEGLGREGGFDPAEIYDRLSPGVVTILSLFKGGSSLLEDGGEGGQGSGFVLDGNGYIATNAHVVTTEKASGTEQADQVYVEFLDGNRVPAEIVGDDPNADVALLKVEPGGALAHAAPPRRVAHDRGRGAGGGDRQPVRGAPVALDRGDLGARPHDPLAHAVRDRRCHPDGRRDQPRQLRRAAARRRGARDRHQRADQVAVRRRRGSRIRGPRGRRAQVAARAARERARGLRLPGG